MWHSLLRILFPSPCIRCGFLSDALCSNCYEQLPFTPHRRELSDLSVVAPYFYVEHSLLSELIYPFKYSHQADLFRILAPGLVQSLKLLSYDLKGLILVPIPLHKDRLLERGYNQSELLAKAVAKCLGCRVATVLVRVKDTGFQSHLTKKSARQENMKGAFSVNGIIPKDSQIVLVDDIVTSGSTLLSCAETLRAHGVQTISALTLADREKNEAHRGN